MIFILLVVPNVFSNSTNVISEDKAGDYQYAEIKEQNTFTWKIGYQENISTIKENKDNTEELERFRTAVLDIKYLIFKLILVASYFLIVVITMLTVHKKNKKMLKDGGVIIAILAVTALSYTIITSIHLNAAFRDATYYYMMLTN